MIRASVIIFSLAGIVSITLAAIGLKFTISFWGGASVMFIGILVESVIVKRIRKKEAKKMRKNAEEESFSPN
jgi:hypothetical protein